MGRGGYAVGRLQRTDAERDGGRGGREGGEGESSGRLQQKGK